MTNVTWKTDGLFKADANKVAGEIFSIGESVKPVEVLEYARNPNSELHKCFDWNDTTAAEKWRVKQARDILCNLVFARIEEGKSEKTNIRITHKVDDSGYKQTVKLVRNEDEYAALLHQALKELDIFKRKYACLSELEQIMELIDEL